MELIIFTSSAFISIAAGHKIQIRSAPFNVSSTARQQKMLIVYGHRTNLKLNNRLKDKPGVVAAVYENL
jgi:hypothetical protein